MKDQTNEIRIYVACLAAYNNGNLHGVWIDACQDEDAIQDAINAMLKASPEEDAEEWAIHDFEGFEGAVIAEYQSIESVTEIAAFIAEHGEIAGKLLEYFSGVDSARTAIEDNYASEYTSLADFAEEITSETTSIPENLQYYIDYERMARNLEINDVLTIETGFEQVHVFWSH